MKGSAARAWPWAAAAPVFCVLAVANSAGYRYGVSDLAFYLPAAFERLDPALFPRDGALLAVQARFTLGDELLAAALAAGGASGIAAPATVYVLHILALLALYAGAIALGSAVFRSPWSVAALAAALTLRHAVAQTGVNTLEGYFHPRILAFGLCVLAIALFVRRGVWPALALTAAAGAVHTTTALWVALLIGVAGFASEPRARGPLVFAGAAAGVIGLWALAAGPLAGRLTPMDAEWLSVLADRSYLFPDRWRLDVWLTHALSVALIGWAAVAKRRDGTLRPRERGLAAGALGLVFVFAAFVPAVARRLALAVQLQPARVFWVLDLLATVSVIWLVERAAARGRPRAPLALALLLVLASSARGLYLMTIAFPERSLAVVSEPATAWSDAMRWARRHTPPDAHWLAHPDHAFRYGESLRVGARRDVFHESSKDPAIAMYDRRVAMRVRERAAAVSAFDTITAADARALASRYGLQYLITERSLPLPVAYRNARFTVYRLD